MVAGAALSAGVAPSVLIIDDDGDVREYLEDVFHFEGFDVTLLSDPTVVVRRIRERQFHLLVVDLMMPKIDGLDLLARIRALDPQIAVIMVTGYPSLDSYMASIRLGISAYLAHPITPDELRQAIARSVKTMRGEGDLHAAIGQQIRDAREARGLTLEQLADLTSLSVALLLQIECGVDVATVSALIKIATVLDLRLTRLFARY